MNQKTKFTASWKRSSQPRKQHKYLARAPLHHRQKLLHGHLSKPLREKYGTRSIQVKAGDRVKVLRGEFRGKEGKVERISLKRGRVYVGGVERVKADSTKIPVHLPSCNLLITELDLGDRRRKEGLTSRRQTSTLQQQEAGQPTTVRRQT